MPDLESPSHSQSLVPQRVGEWLRRTAPPKWSNGSGVVHIADLFSGCGGMSLGASVAIHQHGLRPNIDLAVDLDAVALEVYYANFESIASWIRHDSMDRLFAADIDAELTGPERYLRRHAGGLDLLLAGPPCQGHSDLNNRTRRDDPRNALYLQAVRAIRVLEPRAALIENVPSVMHDSRGVVDRSHEALAALGYSISSAILDASQSGIAQRRRRHFLIVSQRPHAEGMRRLSHLGRGHGAATVRDAIGDLESFTSESTGLFDVASRMTVENKHRSQWLYEHDEYDLPDHLRPACHADGNHSYRSVYGRLRWDEPAQTITTGFGSMGQGRYLHPQACRTITPHEAARLQGFPDFFSFRDVVQRTALQRLIGNAVPPPLACAVVDTMLAEGMLSR